MPLVPHDPQAPPTRQMHAALEKIAALACVKKAPRMMPRGALSDDDVAPSDHRPAPRPRRRHRPAGREYLPVTDATPVISLNEGSTPLIHSPKLSARVGRGCEVFIKYEGLNPTGSFKDRGMTMAISKAVEAGAQAVICASARAIPAPPPPPMPRARASTCIVLLPAGKIAFGKLAQAFMYGAKVVAIDGNFDDALRLVREIGETEPIAIVNSINPYRLARAEDRGLRDHRGARRRAGHCTCCRSATPETSAPTGWATRNFTGSAKRRKLPEDGRVSRPPAPRRFFTAKSSRSRRRSRPRSASAIRRAGNWRPPRSRDSGGSIDIVTDAEILAAQQWLAANEGIFVEPASAASIAGLFKCLGDDALRRLPVPADRRRAAASSAPSPATA